MQINSKPRTDVNVTEADLLTIPKGPRTEACLRNNCVVGVQYLEAWLGGLGCVPLYNLMEDAATAEICRTQVPQALNLFQKPCQAFHLCLILCCMLLPDSLFSTSCKWFARAGASSSAVTGLWKDQ